MAFTKIAVLLALVLVAAALPQRSYDDQQEEEERSYDGSYEDAKYEFKYEVDEDSTEFGHAEQRDGDETRGTYYVQLPDGRKQTVNYYVDGDSGYVAEVSYSGEARYSEEEESYQERSRYDN